MDSIVCDIAGNPLTSRGAFFKSKRLADSLRAIATVLTCQARISDAQRQGGRLRPIATDLVHGSSTMVQNRELFIRTYGKLSENYDKLWITKTKLGMTCHKPLNTSYEIKSVNVITSNTTLLETCHNFNTKTNKLDTHIAPINALPLKQNRDCIVSHSFVRCRSRILKRLQELNVKDRHREASRIPVKKIVNLMRKNKKRRRRLKLLIKHPIPISSFWHNLLSITFRKYVFQRQINTWPQYCKPSNCDKNNINCKCRKQGSTQNRTRKRMFRSKESKLLPTTKCIIQKLETSDKYSLLLCGDIESNPGPVMNTLMSVLTARLARIGLEPVNIAGDGNCFFRSVSYQLYQTEDCHAQIRALAIQHLINCPEHFIESNTQQSWVQYLQDMSTLGTWADHIIIQAVANANSLRIHITESAPNFCESTVVSSVYAESDENVRDIYIGHLDELHYMSTTPTAQSVSRQVENGKANKLQSKANSQNLQTKSRKSYMREYMMKRRKDENLKKKENERKKTYNKNYRIANPEKVKELLKKAAVTYRQSNPDKEKQTKITYRESNPEKTKDSFKKATATYTQSNPDKVKQTKITYRKSNPKKIKDSFKKSTVTYRQSNNEKNRESSKMSSRIYNENYPERLKNIQKRNYIKRKFAQNENEAEMNKQKRLKLNLNSQITCETSSQGENNSTEARSPMTIAQATETFHKNISVGPEHICTCCDQLWYRSSVTECNPSLYKSCSNQIVNLCLTGVKSIDNTEWICGTCHSNLKAGKLPSCAKANKMTFPEKPDVLSDLTPLEERLISPRIPFMQLRELPSGGQLSIHGNVVNVPADVNSTVSVLPRPINESQTIPIKLKRRLGYKHHYQFQNVRPSKVLEAARYLVCNSEIFKNEGIQVMDNYETNPLNNVNEEAWSEFIADSTEETSDIVSNEANIQSQENVATMQASNDSIDNDTDDEWCEATERASGVMDTLLQEPDITQDGDKIISFAPGEGNRPLGIFIDKDSEFLSFPTIYCGKRQADNSERLVPVHYSTLCKWELRSKDRRVAQSVPNIFYKLKKLQIRQIQGSASLSLRKCKTKGKTYTAGDLKSESSLNKLINLDEGFRVFRNLRGSPPYFERCKKDLFAMIRQLGKPTWFCSFSAAETRWIHLIKILGRLIDNKDYTEDEVKRMTWQKKSELIQKDPVTCARNFEHMVQLFIHNFIKSSSHPIGEVVDFFYRVEFQQRGSPHIHGLFWIKNTPEYGKDSDEDIAKFVDRYVSCKGDSDDLTELVNLQRHKHSKTCKKRGHAVCRFNFPLPPMPRTMILEPLSETDLDENVADILKKALERIRSLLDSIKADETMTFVKFLEMLDLSEHEYIKAIRLSLKNNTLFLKRSPAEIRINCYNPHLLKAWKANMDIQFVLDPYACAVYILSYITKGQRGMSKLLRKACEEAKEGNKNIVNKVRHIGNKFLNAVEISAQEAVYLVLQMPLRRSSRDFQFINTSDPDERTFLLKSMDKIKDLPDNSLDIESDNVIKRYQRRPKQLQNLCLADFVAWYNCKSENKEQRKPKPNSPLTNDYLPENNLNDNVDDDLSDVEQTSENNEYEMKGGMTLVKRQKPRIIRSVRFNKNKDPENYCREQIMLYTPWRNETTDLLKDFQTYEDRFEVVKDVIEQNRKQYENHTEALDQAVQDIESEEFGNVVAPNAQYRDEQDKEVGPKVSELFGCFDPGKDKQHAQYDLINDIGIYPRTNDDEELVAKRLKDADFRKLVQSLNIEQKEFFYHVLNSVKTGKLPLRLFLSGGAGVGKSTVTNALYEALIRYLNYQPENDPDDLSVVKVAPTGKAAFNIRGNTLHSAFKIPANRGFNYCTLDRDRLNTIRSQLQRMKVVLIDEISMVGGGMFNFLDLRLQQIMGTKEPFGGISMITVGDLFQLKPVFDHWIFENSKDGYAALATNLWQQYFQMFELSEIMRQKEDKDFAEILNRIREGKHTEADIEILKERILKLSPQHPDYPINSTHLFGTNMAVDQHNHDIFHKSTNEKVEIKAIDIVLGDLSDELKEKVKKQIPNDPSKTMGLYSVCSILKDAKYDLTTNVSVVDGMTNGAECVIKKVDYRLPGSSRPSIIWVSFQEEHIGNNYRKEYAHLYNKSIERHWIPILEVTRQFRKHQMQVLRRQFPLRPSAAKTIHRCQGDTLTEAVVDLPSSKREHMHYVALSRLRSISGLHILNLNENRIAVSKKVQEEMARLRQTATLNSHIPFLYKDTSESFKILFQNVRSLHLHLADVASDYNVKAADINIFVETALCSNDNNVLYEILGYQLFRNDFMPRGTRTPYGTAIYVKDEVQCHSEPLRCNYNDVEMTLLKVNQPVNNLHIVGIYRSKSKVNISSFIDALKHLHFTFINDPNTPVVILGDFNVNLVENASDKNTLCKYLIEEKQYVQLISEVTTDYKTQIDHIYTNIPERVKKSGVLESYFSDHKPIFVSLI
jgi:endonuclease/exonuclease/phosphatase (EEP) superfamily protein YafD